ncbi:VC0807 family protein [Nonomuraea aurantiaca]|uniref:VC0807 family protein n=1 Tax=Nonomuraea aurantiaca TaxID=2878562 RepID=UPI001CD92F23|nr:VC0807 family protein [Nonomuraea aurantiaca]MCA2227609.1 hypothetical protein [Nonomuraea aurantiaca]
MKGGFVKTILADVAPPIAAYYLLRAFHVSEYTALLTATAVGLARTAYIALRERRLDGFAAFTGLVFGIGLVLAFFTGDERFMLAIKSVSTFAIAAVLMATCLIGRPAAFALAIRFGAEDEKTAARWRVLYQADPAFRRVYLVMTVTWALALLAESLIRIPLIYLLPVDVMTGLSTVLLVGTLCLIAAWSAWYGKRGELATLAGTATDSPDSSARP